MTNNTMAEYLPPQQPYTSRNRSPSPRGAFLHPPPSSENAKIQRPAPRLRRALPRLHRRPSDPSFGQAALFGRRRPA